MSKFLNRNFAGQKRVHDIQSSERKKLSTKNTIPVKVNIQI